MSKPSQKIIIMIKKYNFAFFDFDGVIVDSEFIRINSYKKVFYELYNIEIEVNKSMIGRSESFNLKSILDKNNLDSNLKILKNLKKVRSKILISEAKHGFEAVECVMEIIANLDLMKIPMAIVTNSSYQYISAAFSKLDIDINSFKIFTADDVSSPKPNPEIYLKTLASVGQTSENVLVFEDSPSGILAAKSAGIDTVGVHTSFDKTILKSNYSLDKANIDQVHAILSLFGLKDA
jgi:HAD superfamily hydrolase (TIGR01509 family)